MDDYQTNYYLTHKQLKKLWWNIIAGSKATKIVYWDIIEDSDVSKTKEQREENKQFFIKYHNVFNIEQTDLVPDEDISEQIEQNDNYNQAIGLVMKYKDRPEILTWPQPCYIPKSDTIKIPTLSYFTGSDEYYSTLFHELIHSTWHKSRLSREWIISKNYFGSESYSVEELIAEIGSMFLCNYAWIDNSIVENQVSYIDNWLKVIKGNKLSIIKASSEAEKAVEHIMKHWKN